MIDAPSTRNTADAMEALAKLDDEGPAIALKPKSLKLSELQAAQDVLQPRTSR